MRLLMLPEKRKRKRKRGEERSVLELLKTAFIFKLKLRTIYRTSEIEELFFRKPYNNFYVANKFIFVVEE